MSDNIRVEVCSFEHGIEHMLEEMMDHWDEVPFGNFDMGLDLNIGTYLVAEKDGYLRCYMVYVDDTPVGYMSVLASEMIQHKGVMQAVTDAFYIAPKYRGGGLFARLLTYVEHDLAQHGIRFLSVGINPNYDPELQNALEQHLGYQHTETTVTKELI